MTVAGMEISSSNKTQPAKRAVLARQILLEEALARRGDCDYWVGRLSDSALSTATAISALGFYFLESNTELESERRRASFQMQSGLDWLAGEQNEDGGWGDTPGCYSNISTTMLVIAAARAARVDSTWGERLRRADEFVKKAGGVQGIRDRYGRDRTFSVPILSNAAMSGLVPWKEVSALPFEAACVPQKFYNLMRLPVVSYAIPALVAIGQAKFACDPPRNPITRWIRAAAVRRSLSVLKKMQPASGGFLEAIPLTSFVAMGLIHARQSQHPVVHQSIRFLLDAFRPAGCWPIDTNLAIWNTTLMVNAIATHWPEDGLSREAWSRTIDWLLACQNRTRHPFAGAAPGGWGWSDLSGAVPDADDTSGAMLALRQLHDRVATSEQQSRIEEAIRLSLKWLLDLQNRDGGWPTFCRGWGKLPFDRSGADLTAHAIRGLLAWRNLESSVAVSKAIDRGFAYLARQQLSNGSWLPLWFGNQDHSGCENPDYGTSKVLLAYLAAGRIDTPAAQNGLNWVLQNQDKFGGWGGGPSVRPANEQLGLASFEETALCCDLLGAVLEAGKCLRIEEISTAAARAQEWLATAIEQGEHRVSRPIGFYFANLWYDEQLYPISFGLAALGRFAR